MLQDPLGNAAYRISSPWGYRTHPVTGKKSAFHNGIDMAVPQGTPVYAPADGTISSVLDNDVCGYGLVIKHGNNLWTGYCHFSRIDVRKGQKVRAGEQIALSGGGKGTRGAGRSTGPHLHFIAYRAHGSVPGGDDENTIRGRKKNLTSIDPLPLITEVSPTWQMPTLNPFTLAGEWWDWWWEAPSIDPAEDHADPPKAAPRRRTAPRTNGQASWTLGDTGGYQLRLVGTHGAVSPGSAAPGPYSVQAFNGSAWVNTGNVTMQGGHSYVLAASGGRVKLLER